MSDSTPNTVAVGGGLFAMACGAADNLIAAVAPQFPPVPAAGMQPGVIVGTAGAIIAATPLIVKGIESLVTVLTKLVDVFGRAIDTIAKDRAEGRANAIRLAEIAALKVQVDRTERYAHDRIHEVLNDVNANTMVREDHEARLGSVEAAVDSVKLAMAAALQIDREWIEAAHTRYGIPLPDGFRNRSFDPRPPAAEPAS